MSEWKPLRDRFDKLPLVLAGPIVRRVERSQVSVWIACKRKVTDLVLEISRNSSSGGEFKGNSKKHTTIMLGKNLHIALLTYQLEDIKKTNPSILLKAGVKYYYNIYFGSENKRLNGRGILANGGGVRKITFNREKLPSFVTPVQEIEDLRIMHASCRKPHGKGLDAMRAKYYILEATIKKGDKDHKFRPQQLFLTGDQIYADDVSDVLLYMIRDAIQPILGWPETDSASVPTYKWNDYRYSNEDIKAVIKTELEQGELKGLSFSPGRRQKVCEEIGFTSGAAKSHLLFLSEYYLMYLFAWSTEVWPSAKMFPSKTTIPLDSKDSNHFDYSKGSLKQFYFTIDKVRTVLANISTYMIFDDHEVTDDWFLNYDWTKKNLGTDHINKISKRFLCNGLLAYSLFQGWGNNINLITSKLKRIVEKIGNEPQKSESWDTLEGLILPKIKKTSTNTFKLSGGLEWHYSIKFGKYQIICLDIRTKRGFYKGLSDGGFPSLINIQGIQKQIPTKNSKPLTILISPTPVFGKYLIDRLQRIVATGGNTGKEWQDAEAWFLNPKAYEKLLTTIKKLKKVVILSGDVHYGFSVSVKEKPGYYAQFCSSAAKNTGTMNEISSLIHSSTFIEDNIKRVLQMVFPETIPLDIEQKFKEIYKSREIIPIEDIRKDFKERAGYKGFIQLPFELSETITQARIDSLPAIAGASTKNAPGERLVVGKNNIGYINFEKWTSDYKVEHWIWFSLITHSWESIYPVAIHEVNLS